ncbi:MAG: hypothetical protein IH614_00455, partial [Desulfuromonadales bacterium]|nr:hypothetical protein [Desulfuromonadales bacterium]
LGGHLPTFPGYTALHLGETDLQLRRVLAERVERVRDRLADLLGADRDPRGGVDQALKTLATLRESFLLQPREMRLLRELPPAREEQLFDLDLALLERVAALDPLVEQLAVASPSARAGELERLQQALAEVDQLFRRRDELLLQEVEKG